jgi:hypothetical protein
MPATVINMRRIFIIFSLCVSLISCRGQNAFVEDRLKTADKFIECLKNNTPDKILDYSYKGVEDKIDNKESRDFYVSKASKFINKFGLPPKDKWLIKYNAEDAFDRLRITIPIFEGYDTEFNLLKADIVIAFPPPQISDKIYRYEIVDRYKPELIQAPPLIDITKH